MIYWKVHAIHPLPYWNILLIWRWNSIVKLRRKNLNDLSNIPPVVIWIEKFIHILRSMALIITFREWQCFEITTCTRYRLSNWTIAKIANFRDRYSCSVIFSSSIPPPIPRPTYQNVESFVQSPKLIIISNLKW